MKAVLFVVSALVIFGAFLAKAQKETFKTAAVSLPLSPENIEALRAFKQLGFDEQSASGRMRQSDISVHHVYHDPTQSRGSFKPYGSSKYGSSSSRDHSSSSFQSSSYITGQKEKQNQVSSISSMWPNNVKNDMSNSGYSQHQSRSHPNDILSNMGVELPSEQILGKARHSFHHTCKIILITFCVLFQPKKVLSEYFW